MSLAPSLSELHPLWPQWVLHSCVLFTLGLACGALDLDNFLPSRLIPKSLRFHLEPAFWGDPS